MTLPHRDSAHPAVRQCPALRQGRWRVAAWLAVLCVALGTGALVWAAEFITPPGLNVEGQEAVLRQQVQGIAEGLVGDDLVEVIANVRYVRTDGQGGERIKLPGVNHFITPTGKGGQIVSGHARIRQVLVMVKDSSHSSVEALAEEIRQQGNFNPANGDLVRVVKVPASGKDQQAAARNEDEQSGALAEDTEALSKRLKRQRNRMAQQEDKEALSEMLAQGSLAEAQATTYLIKARQAYFNGNYDRALDQILQSIEQNPNNPQAYAMLGSLYYAVDWKQLALKYWEKSLTLDPDNREIQELVARLRSSPIDR